MIFTDSYVDDKDEKASEIRETTRFHEPILQYRDGEYSAPYCTVRYVEKNIKALHFFDEELTASKDNTLSFPLVESDYLLVALGSDEENLSVAHKLQQYVGQYHLSREEQRKTVIAYVIYDSELCRLLNLNKRYCSFDHQCDIYMQAIGSRTEVYSWQNIFMDEKKRTGEKIRSAQLRKERIQSYQSRVADEYQYWAKRSRRMHRGYKAFSAGELQVSLFDEGMTDEAYQNALAEAENRYRQKAIGHEYDPMLRHKLAWLEHRRWNAFMRIKGFRCTKDFEKYYVSEHSHKHRELKLHPCLVECDKLGIKAEMDANGEMIEGTQYRKGQGEVSDYLDDLSYELYARGFIAYNFKQNDYPMHDFKD